MADSSYTPSLPLIHSGKVRSLYQWHDPDQILMIASDRVSAFDHILDVEIRHKGVILTQMSKWWFERLSDITPNHLVNPPADLGRWKGRGLVVEKLQMVPIEAVVRGYLTGSGWQEYQRTQTVCSVALPPGLHDGSRLPEPIFTPAFKAEMGQHDENISFEKMKELVGDDTAEKIKDLSLACYLKAAALADERGLIIADTKFEWGYRSDHTLVLADEALTPDSSRFWDRADWENDRLTSFDKQYLRDWLDHESGWDRKKNSAPPPIPDHVVKATYERYCQAYRILTGEDIAEEILEADQLDS